MPSKARLSALHWVHPLAFDHHKEINDRLNMETNIVAPKVFISHASEDKDRFVLSFAKALLQNGIDAWVDQWEMHLGDSIVEKIFEDGVAQASAVIVILSNFSINKPWVREEMNSAFVQRVNKGTRLIPIILDDCHVPTALQSLQWIKVDEPSLIDKPLQRVVAAILGTNDKPPLGSLPAYTKLLDETIGDLPVIDSAVLKLACEEALTIGHNHIDICKVYLNNSRLIIPSSELKDSLHVLNRKRMIDVIDLAGGPEFQSILVTYLGFEIFAKNCIENYGKIVSEVSAAIVNKNIQNNQALHEKLAHEPFLIDHILDSLKINGDIDLKEYMGGFKRIYNISPNLKRTLGF
jgi:hypothetical protein